ncbi:MAG TPA: hypothetical protein VMM93_07135 [Vicinamibacterales bacterium]|nr:hypothetical protein [Vicinamibacterales bacterium]
MLNAFDWANVNPVTGVSGITRTAFETTTLTGATTSRTVQLVSRVT